MFCLHGDVLKNPRRLVVIDDVWASREPGVQFGAQKPQRLRVSLAYHMDAVTNQQRSRHANASRVVDGLFEAAPNGDHLGAARGAAVCEQGKVDAMLQGHDQHGLCTGQHRLREVSSVLIEDLGGPIQHREAISTMEVWHGSGCPEPKVLWAKAEGAHARVGQPDRSRGGEAIVCPVDATGQALQTPAHEDPPGVV